jgi:uncharacterized membrane protein
MNKTAITQNTHKMTFANIILLATATTTALIAGLYYAWSCSVIDGLGKLPDAGYIAAMQSLNREILNPLFYMSFMGSLLLLPVCTWVHYSKPVSLRFYLLLAATLLYAFGSFGVTVAGNVPLNDALDGFNLHSASAEEIARFRVQFEVPWNRLHSIRTIANFIALILVLLTCIQNDKA